MLQKALGGLFLFGIVPVCTGLLWSGGMGVKKRSAAHIYLAGFLIQLAVFQLIAVPVMVKNAHGMELLTELASAVLAALCAAGVVCFGRKKRAERRNGANGGISLTGAGRHMAEALFALSWECRIFWLIALAAIGVQMYMAFAYASFDGDDAYYVVQSVLADQTGVLNRIRPYTGLSTDLDIRHALAALPLWEAYVARMTGIHAAIVAHTLLPLVLIPLTYLCYFEIGRKLLGAANVKLPIFMTLVSILQIWGNTSIYTNATFFLMRTWQGKSIMANLILLVQIWLLLEVFDKKREGSSAGYWLLLIVNNVAAAMMTSMGAFLAAMFLGITGLVAAIRQKKLSILFKTAACCIPNVVYLLMLLVMG